MKKQLCLLLLVLAPGIAAMAGVLDGDPTHWSLRPLTLPPVPPGAPHPIDAFIQDTLIRQGRTQAPEADRRTLLRRLSYDLVGLPPSPEDLDGFLSDPSPAAYNAQVERLLASPRYGEHWARHWLDVANYADTHGNDHDYRRPNAWRYRDYVIAALNADKPYGRFVQEQVAGDALFPDDPDATIALGFLAASPWDHTLMVTVREDTVDHRMAQNLDRDSMVGSVIGTFQSLTVQCARCHHHKFDPISQRDYYALQAVFAGVDRADRPVDSDPATHQARARLREQRWQIEVRHPALLARLETQEIVGVVNAWEDAWRRREQAWDELTVVSVISTDGSTLIRQGDGSWFVSGTRPERDTYVITARANPGNLRALRLEVLPDDRLPQRGPGRWDNGNFHLSEVRAFLSNHGGGESGTPITWGRAFADHNEGPSISAAQAIDGKSETHWGIHPRYGEPHEAVFEFKDPVTAAATPEATWTLLLEHRAGAKGHGIGRFRLSTTTHDPASSRLLPIPLGIRDILRVAPPERTPYQRQELALAVLRWETDQALDRLPEPGWVYAVSRDFPPDGPNFKPSPLPRPIHVLGRGDLSKPGDAVTPGALQCLPQFPGDLAVADLRDESQRRAALARWLVDRRNVLTWRSIVNRVWSYHFGRGLCDTPNDFGRMGSAPSHPELLDWLAVWFRDEAQGSLKALHRLIVTSATWRQSSHAREPSDTDPDNRLLWRQNRTRLSAEQIRDSTLILGEQLDLTLGGPPAIQFNARGDATFNSGGNPPFVDYELFDPDAPDARRRAVYRFVFRTVPDPLMDALDCPDGGAVTPARIPSTTALQALALLNNPFLIRQAQHIASRVARSADRPETQADAAFRRILLRKARPAERPSMAAYIENHGLANAVHVLLNSNEFLYLD